MAAAVVMMSSLLAATGWLVGGEAAAKTTTTTVPRRSTTTASRRSTGVQKHGLRTVLSPVGLNVRMEPAKGAKVIGTAAQGTRLRVLGHSAKAGGWYRVKGATVTGWITDSATLSAPGRFQSYASSTHQFGALYPMGWSFAEVPPASVVFRARPGPETIVATTAATVAQLPPGRSGYVLSKSQQVVVCGVTSYLQTYVHSGIATTTAPAQGGVPAQRYLAQVRLTLDPQHALAIEANLPKLSGLQSIRNFVDSVTFPFPACGI